MKEQNFRLCVFKFINLLIILILILSSLIFSQSYHPTEKDWKAFDGNSINAWVTNYGSLFRHPVTGNSGFEWPKGSGMYAIYAAGLCIGALVEGEPRVAVAQYQYEFRPGTIDEGNYLPNDPTDSRYRIYKIQKGITNSWDYQNWPYWDGAPLDENGNPLLIGEQTLWSVYNDADSSQHIEFESLPLGVEVQQTVFGDLRFPTSSDFLFIRWLVINKGVNYLDSVYLCIWIDPDLGDSGDDLDGCDTLLSLGYCYNGFDHDGEYGDHPPAVGFQVCQGPLVKSPGDSGVFAGRKIPGSKNLIINSFLDINHSNENHGFPQTPRHVWNYMHSLWKNGQHMTYGGMGIDPNNPKTNYMHSGDPESGTGWLDACPADRILMMSSGSFNLAPGDSNEMVAAVIIARGNSHLNSVTELKRIASALQTGYDSNLYKLLRSYSKKPTQITGLRLFQNYPNPFNSQTTISYSLPVNRVVKLEIFNILGRRVATLVNERQEPDEYEVVWDASGMASGIYFARLTVAQYTFTKKLLLMK